jgi:hypothetical protein
LWDSPRQREAYAWFMVELPNLRVAFRWSADHDDLDTASAIASYAGFLAIWVEQYEPVGWAEELIKPARVVGHRRLAQLYVLAAECYAAGRIDESVGYAEAAQRAIESGHFDQVPYEFEVSLGGTNVTIGAPDRMVELCRNIIAREPGTHTLAWVFRVMGLTLAGATDEAMVTSERVVTTAYATDNPAVLAYVLLARGMIFRDTDPVAAYDVDRRGLTIAQDSGNRLIESHPAGNLSIEASHGDPLHAFDYVTLAIRHFYDAGAFSHLHIPLAILATVLDRLGHYEPAATIIEFAATPIVRTGYREVNTTMMHLREVLGDEAYESFARAGEDMTNAEMAAYALEQIDWAGAALQSDSR